jgi:hypothetical protein
MKNTMNIATTLQDCLSYNNRFANAKLNADQLSAENLKTWSTLVADLHKAAYGVYEFCENNDLKAEDESVNKDAVYSALRAILAELGEVKGYKLHANDALAINVIGYAGKRGNDDSPALQLCLSKIRNNTTLLDKYSKLNGVSEETIAAIKKDIETLEQEKAVLLAAPDNRIKKPTRTSATMFRLEVEHRLARAINDQKAKSWEQLEAEEKARKDKKKQARKDKAAAEKKSK